MQIDNLSAMTFVGLMTIGFVNVISFFKSDMDPKVKFGIAVAFAFSLTFVPEELGAIVLDKAKVAIEAALATSGAYKLAQKMSGE